MKVLKCLNKECEEYKSKIVTRIVEIEGKTLPEDRKCSSCQVKRKEEKIKDSRFD